MNKRLPTIPIYVQRAFIHWHRSQRFFVYICVRSCDVFLHYLLLVLISLIEISCQLCSVKLKGEIIPFVSSSSAFQCWLISKCATTQQRQFGWSQCSNKFVDNSWTIKIGKEEVEEKKVLFVPIFFFASSFFPLKIEKKRD